MTSFGSGSQNPFRAATVPTQNSALPFGLTAEDIAHLTNYPSLGRLFEENDTAALAGMKNSLTATFNDLERVIRRGSAEDARHAQAAADAVKITLDFLQMLENNRAR